MGKVIADLHTHGADSYGFVWRNGRPYSPTDLPQRLLEHCFSFDEETLVGVVNFDDTRAEHILKEMKKLRGYEFKHDGPLLSVSNGRKRANFVSGQEIPTDRGHVLVIAPKKNILSKKLRDVLKEAKDLGGFVIADHPLVQFGVVGNFLNRYVNQGAQLSLGEREIEEFRDYIDAAEVWNGYLGEKYHADQNALADRHGLSKTSSTDASRVKHTLNSHVVFENLEFPMSADEFRQGLEEGLAMNPELVMGLNGHGEYLRHGVSAVARSSMHKVGLIRRGYAKLEENAP